jgi:hypothetical protein
MVLEPIWTAGTTPPVNDNTLIGPILGSPFAGINTSWMVSLANAAVPTAIDAASAASERLTDFRFMMFSHY